MSIAKLQDKIENISSGKFVLEHTSKKTKQSAGTLKEND
jgi:hypothetical protein